MALPDPMSVPTPSVAQASRSDAALFSGLERACDATLEIAARCHLDLPLARSTFRGPMFPQARPRTRCSKTVVARAWSGATTRSRPRRSGGCSTSSR